MMTAPYGLVRMDAPPGCRSRPIFIRTKPSTTGPGMGARMMGWFLASLLFSGLAFATVGLPFEQARFEALQREGRPILIWFHVDWCPTCKVQDRILRRLTALPELRRLTILRVDYDHQKDEVRKFRAIRQSTFILFNGGKEVGRSLGGTDQEDILEFLRAAF